VLEGKEFYSVDAEGQGFVEYIEKLANEKGLAAFKMN
jgi:hypothetical protein